MNYRIALSIFIALFVLTHSSAQEIKFGKVSKKELEEAFYPADSSADAVVLFKKRRTYYVYNPTGWALITEVTERIKIYNKDGFEFASKKIPVYMKGSDEMLNIKANTYNLIEGKIEKTKLERSSIYSERLNDRWGSKNFTMPNLREGSVIEWKYEKSSPYYASIDEVICQYDIPIKTLDCEIRIPQYFEFNFYPNPYYQVNISRSKRTTSFFSQSSTIENVYKFSDTNIPALREEPFMNNVNNYRASIRFEISAFVPYRGVPKYYNSNWEVVTKEIYDSSYFGGQLDKSRFFMDDLSIIIAKSKSQREKLDNIFNHVKNKIEWNESRGKYTSKEGVVKAYKEGKGNVAEINLLLVSMLREAQLDANPILVSTRSNGIPLFPTTDGFNYVIAGVELGDEIILLDATEKYSTPNVLPIRDLNWEGRLIREDGTSMAVNLYPKKYNAKSVKMNVKLDETGGLSGVMISTYKNLGAMIYRKNKGLLSEGELISKIEQDHNDIEVENIRLNNKEALDKPVTEMVQFIADNQVDMVGNKIYVSPLLFLTEKENPFKLQSRTYPIDFASAWRDDVNLVLEIPEGYQVESKPEDLVFNLPNNMGTYHLKTQISGNRISISSSTKMNMAIVGANHYEQIKDLFKQAIDKQQEKIVLVQGP